MYEELYMCIHMPILWRCLRSRQKHIQASHQCLKQMVLHLLPQELPIPWEYKQLPAIRTFMPTSPGSPGSPSSPGSPCTKIKTWSQTAQCIPRWLQDAEVSIPHSSELIRSEMTTRDELLSCDNRTYSHAFTAVSSRRPRWAQGSLEEKKREYQLQWGSKESII